jgi:hypothetical protein
MPSTYTLNNGIELIGTGEQSGTWGDTTNTNLGLLDVALDGQVTVALASAGSSGSPNSLPISDGTASNGRNRMVVFSDSGDLGATAYVQLTPNDAEKIIYIRNSLSGSRSVILFQGTYNASNDYEVPAGTTAVVYFDGAGAGAVAANVFNNAYFDGLRLGSVSVTAILDEDNMASDSATALATQQSIKAYVDAQVGTVDTLAEILAIGNTTGATDIAVDSAQKVQFRDAAIYINSSVDGQLDIVADTEIQIAATTIDVNGALDVSGTALVTGVLTTTAATVSNGGGQFNGAINVGVDDTGYDVKFFGATTGKSLLWDESADSLIVTGTTTLVGTTNLDAVDIDGATQIDATVTVGVDDTGYDVKFFGATAGAYMLWDESADDLILGGAAGLSVNSTALVTGVLTTTAATVFNGGFASNAPSTISSANNLDTLQLISTDADANAGPNLRFYRNSGSPADNDLMAKVDFEGRNDNSQDVVYASIENYALDVSDGTEDGELTFYTIVNGTSRNRLDFTNTQTVFNESSVDLDFRVESNANINMLFVDAGGEVVTIGGIADGTSEDAGYFPLQVGNTASGSTILQMLSATDAACTIHMGDSADGVGRYDGYISYGHGDRSMLFGTAAVTALTIDVSGNIIIANTGGTLYTTTAGTSNFRAGVNAGNSIASGGDYNTVVGDEAGTAITTGDGMVAIGYQALMTEDTQGYSTAVGSGALKMQNTGSSAFNVAVGHEAGVAVSTGVQNTLVGTYAGHDLNTGSYNVAIGVNALSLGTSLGSTVAIGYTAGKTLATASNNTMIGSQAGEIRTGAGNTIVGQYAGRDGTDGTDNTFIGRNSGYTITTGSKNSILGMYNGNQGGLDIRTSSNNIVLSDGDGNPRVVVDSDGEVSFGGPLTVIELIADGVQGVVIDGPSGVFAASRFNDLCAIFKRENSDGPAVHFMRDASIVGSIAVTESSTAYNTSSDYRLKENVNYTWDATTRLKQLKPAQFNFIADADTTVDGFLAHEAQEIVPECVTGAKDAVDADGVAVMQGIDQSKLVPLLVKTIQELEARITALEGA